MGGTPWAASPRRAWWSSSPPASLLRPGDLPERPPEPKVGVKTLSGRSIEKDPLYSAKGWAEFTSGFAVGGLSGVLWCFILTQTLPFYYLTPDAVVGSITP